MAVDPTQLLSDAACIEACIPPGMMQAAQVGQMVQPSIVVTSIVGQPGLGVTRLLMGANPQRRRAVIQNIGNTLVYIGNSTVTPTTGFTLPALASGIISRIEVFTQGELYMNDGTVGQNVSVMEFLTP